MNSNLSEERRDDDANERTTLLGGVVNDGSRPVLGGFLTRNHNKLFIFGAVIGFCLLAMGAFLVSPRRIVLDRTIKLNAGLNYISPFNVSVIKDRNSNVVGKIYHFTEQFTIQNDNFYPIKLNRVEMKLHRDTHVNYPHISHCESTSISAKSSKNIELNVKFILYEANDEYARWCVRNQINQFMTLVTSSFSFSTLWNSQEQMSLTSLQFLKC